MLWLLTACFVSEWAFPSCFLSGLQAGLRCAVGTGPNMVPRYAGFWKISKGCGSPWLPRRIWEEVLYHPQETLSYQVVVHTSEKIDFVACSHLDCEMGMVFQSLTSKTARCCRNYFYCLFTPLRGAPFNWNTFSTGHCSSKHRSS